MYSPVPEVQNNGSGRNGRGDSQEGLELIENNRNRQDTRNRSDVGQGLHNHLFDADASCCTNLLMHPNLKALLTMLLCNTLFTVAQFIGASIANSISMAADSGTMSIDSITYVINIITEYRKLSGKSSKNLELFASSFSVLALFGVTGFILYDGIFRLCCDPGEAPVNAQIMFAFTVVNLTIDVLQCHYYFAGKRNETKEHQDENEYVNVNMSSAFVHLFADTLRTATVMVSSILVWGFGTDSVQSDAIGSIVVSVLIFFAGAYVSYEMFALCWTGRARSPSGFTIM